MSAKNSDKDLLENCIAPKLPGITSLKFVKGVALYGPNASGKSTLLEALQALAHFVRHSAKTTDPQDLIKEIIPFGLDADSVNDPTVFSIEFENNGIRYDYRVAATQKQVYHESLHAYPHGKEQEWFSRDWDETSQDFIFTPEHSTGLPRNRDIEKRTLSNSLYLSKAISENRKELEPIYRWFVEHLKFIDLSTDSKIDYNRTLKHLENENSPLREKIQSMMQHADLGHVNVSVISYHNSFSANVLKQLELLLEDGMDFKFNNKEPQMMHKTSGDQSLPLPWDSESCGTKRFFSLIGPWLEILQSGETVCIDELDTSMHPLMVRELLKIFFSEEHNPKGAQIIFTTHNPILLDLSLIRRDQVWFTEKDQTGASHLYSLLEYQPRNKESLVRGYLSGRYGAIPFIPNGLLGKKASTQNQTLSALEK